MGQGNSAIGARQNGASKPYGACDIVEDGSGPVVSSSGDSSAHERGILTPQIVSITGIKVTAAANPPIIGSESDSIWATVNISAEVDPSGPRNIGLPMPLDIVILLDNVYVSFLQTVILHWG